MTPPATVASSSASAAARLASRNRLAARSTTRLTRAAIYRTGPAPKSGTAFAALPVACAIPIGPVTLIVKQSADELTIETRMGAKNKQAASSETLTFKLHGTENSIVGNSGAPIKVKAHLDGATLITETARNVQDSTVTTMDVFSLDASGKELTVHRTLTIQHGYQFPGAANTGTGKDVFIKSKGTKK